MNFLSVCSGIEAASVAWGPLGWKAVAFSEIEPFPCAALAHHYPEIPNLGDMTTLPRRVLTGEAPAPELFCGGTPCQAFSLAGSRESLDDARGNLTLTFVEIANAIDHVRTRAGQPECIVFWENVFGVLSTKDNAFGCFLAGLAGEDEPLQPPGKKWANAGAVYGPQRAVAWRTMDAQYFGVAQRRRRVFVVASARNGFDPAEVLFEWSGVRRDTAPSRKAAETIAPTIRAGASNGGPGHGARSGDSKDELIVPHIAQCLTTGSGQRYDPETETETILPVTHSLTGEGFDASEDGTGRGTPLVPVAFDSRQDPVSSTEVFGALSASSPQAQAVALRGRDGGATAELGGDTAFTLRAATGGGDKPHVMQAMRVRRLTPTECERLQGFPDNYTRIPSWTGWRKMDADETPEQCITDGMEVKQNKKTGRWRVKDVDGPRYKALGNSWAIPNVRWIGRRIEAVASININTEAPLMEDPEIISASQDAVERMKGDGK